MRERLRPAYDAVTTRAIYEAAVDRPLWPGHIVRIARTGEIGRLMWRGGLVADLSCGDAQITTLMGVPDHLLILNDLTNGMWIEDALEDLQPVELFICSETLEHIDDPDALLVKIRGRCGQLLLSTPCDEQPDHEGNFNPEHYWIWSVSDLDDMLAAAGFTDRRFELLTVDGFVFQIWMAS